MDNLNLQHLPALLRLTYSVLATRVFLFVALLMTFGLFCWALAVGTVLALAASGTFAVLVFLPILARSNKEPSDASEAT